jgi:hypothetical protein
VSGGGQLGYLCCDAITCLSIDADLPRGSVLVGVVVVGQRHCLVLFDPVNEVGVIDVWYRVVDCGDIVDGVDHGWLPSRYAADSMKTAAG